MQKTPLGVAVKQAYYAFALLNSSKRLVMAQLAREKQIHILSILLHRTEQRSTRAGADADARDRHIACLFALWHGDGEAFRVAQTQANAVDDVGERDGFIEAHDPTHTRAWVAGLFGCLDGVALVVALAEVERFLLQ